MNILEQNKKRMSQLPQIIEHLQKNGISAERFERELKARRVMESAHVKAVEVKPFGMVEGLRTYIASTHNGLHQYVVKFWEDSESRIGKCNCPSGNLYVCRHLIKAAELDSELNGMGIIFDGFCNYKAGQKAVEEAA